MKISFIGAGRVGSAAAFLTLAKKKVDELAIVDLIDNLAKGEAIDLGQAFLETKVLGGSDFSLIKDSKYVVVTAGKARTADMKREDLFDFNKKVIESVCKEINKYCPKAKMILVTNPSTELGEVAKKLVKNVIVMDNQLDTQRLRYFLKDFDVVNAQSRIVGGHGENMQVENLDDLSADVIDLSFAKTKNAGKEIIELKGYTCWGIAAQIVEMIK